MTETIASNEVTIDLVVSALAVHRVRNKFWRLRLFSVKESYSLRMVKCFVDEEKKYVYAFQDFEKLYSQKRRIATMFLAMFSLWTWYGI